jgi:hypothetical protein
MAAFDHLNLESRNGSAAQQAGTGFESILFDDATVGAGVHGLGEPDCFTDLNLDQVVSALTGGREEYDLGPFFYAPLHHTGAVRYRHEALRDLEHEELRASITRFAAAMRAMREHIVQAESLHYNLQRQAWFLDAVRIYSDAVGSLANELAAQELHSGGFQALREHLREYAASDPFFSLTEETRVLKEALAEIRYAVKSRGGRVTVTRYEGEPDYGAEVEAAFAKFKQGAVKSYMVKLPEHAEMDHVEAQILQCVAELYPDVFGELADYCSRHEDYVEPTIRRFDREVQLYLAYLELIERLRAAGLPFCYPRVSDRSKEIAVDATFDIALAIKLTREDATPVCNDFYLEEPERVFVVTGPNNGGKTTFARTFGQVHFLASLGLLVPGRDARLFLPDRVYTHFEREEDIETLRGKFDDELVRVHHILQEATPSSLIVMNESFSSTSLSDALFVGTEVLRRVLELGALGVYVTFVDELASLGEATVSMVTQIVPENPAERTFKVIRTPADGLAYASAIAEKYGLTYRRLLERIAA